jgi:hypothetical protein
MWKPKTTSLGSRSSGVGQNIQEWWVGENFMLADGNAVQLQWLFESMTKPKEQWFKEGGS